MKPHGKAAGAGRKDGMSEYNTSEGCDPCPFCGEPAKIYRRGGGSGWGVSHDIQNCPIREEDFYPPHYDSREAAVTAWNTQNMLPIPECVLRPTNEGKP